MVLILWSNIFSASVNLTLITKLVLNDTVKLKCTSNNGFGTWFVYKGPSRNVLFQDEAIGSGFDKSKFEIDYISKTSLQISIRQFDINDIDVYLCSHRDKSSNPLDMREIKKISGKCLV